MLKYNITVTENVVLEQVSGTDTTNVIFDVKERERDMDSRITKFHKY
jgi:hypothetical protein